MIGVFDSGSGGLTVVRALRAIAPRADILYLADTAHMPYGSRSDEDVRRLTLSIIGELRAAGATTIVSACNSVSASVIRPMIELLGIRQSDIVEMVGPAIAELSRRNIIQATLVATPVTVRSGMYPSLAQRYGIDLASIAIPDLAKLIEDQAPALKTVPVIRHTLEQVPPTHPTILLGCTHYPLALPLFYSVAQSLGRKFLFIDPAEAVAAEAVRLHGARGHGTLRLRCTGPTETVTRHARAVLEFNHSPEMITSHNQIELS